MLDTLNQNIQNYILNAARQEFKIEPDSKLYGWIKYGSGMLIINLCNTISLILLILAYNFLVNSTSLDLRILEINYIFTFVFPYALLRAVSFGVHADKIRDCTLLSMTYFIGGMLIAVNISIPLWVSILVLLFAGYSFLKYAPAETAKRPLDDNILLFRILSLLLLLAAIIVFIIMRIKQLYIYSNLVLVAMTCQSINLQPFMYKIFAKNERIEK